MYTECFTEASLDYAGVYSEHLCITSANLSSVLSKATPHFQELLSNLVYGIQAAFSVDCSSSCLPSLKMTLLTTKVNKLNP